MMTPAQARRGLHILHVEAPTPKHVENSDRGVLRAAHDPHLNAIDLDGLITKADPHCPVCRPGTCRGHLVGTHWPAPILRDGFHDPLGLLGRHTTVANMTLPEVSRLVARTNGLTYRIHTLAHLVALCGHHGVIAVVEPKPDHRWTLDWPWQQLHGVATRFRTDLRSRTLRDLPEPGAGLARARAARRNSVPAWLIG